MQNEDCQRSHNPWLDGDTTMIIPDFKGNAIVYGHCVRCGQPIQYPTDRVYNGCPYCFARIIYKEDI